MKYLVFSNMPYISKSCCNAPLCSMSDNYIDMQLLPDVGYCKLIKLALDFQSGSHFDRRERKVKESYKIDYRRITAFRVQVDENQSPGLFSIDGEKYEAKVLQARVMPRSAVVFAQNVQQDLFSYIDEETTSKIVHNEQQQYIYQNENQH